MVVFIEVTSSDSVTPPLESHVHVHWTPPSVFSGALLTVQKRFDIANVVVEKCKIKTEIARTISKLLANFFSLNLAILIYSLFLKQNTFISHRVD